jgi:hypothetical protein
MQKYLIYPIALILFLSINPSCNQAPEQQENADTTWMGNSQQEIYTTIEEQLQGFSRTMIETSYRYHELYWAGMDQNWEFAEYQREHILEALQQGFVRRPEHELPARAFMTNALPGMESAIQTQDSEKFMEAFVNLTQTCNNCHQMDEVPFITVVLPKERHTTVQF